MKSVFQLVVKPFLYQINTKYYPCCCTIFIGLSKITPNSIIINKEMTRVKKKKKNSSFPRFPHNFVFYGNN